MKTAITLSIFCFIVTFGGKRRRWQLTKKGELDQVFILKEPVALRCGSGTCSTHGPAESPTRIYISAWFDIYEASSARVVGPVLSRPMCPAAPRK